MTRKIDDKDLAKVTGGTDLQEQPPGSVTKPTGTTPPGSGGGSGPGPSAGSPEAQTPSGGIVDLSE